MLAILIRNECGISWHGMFIIRAPIIANELVTYGRCRFICWFEPPMIWVWMSDVQVLFGYFLSLPMFVSMCFSRWSLPSIGPLRAFPHTLRPLPSRSFPESEREREKAFKIEIVKFLLFLHCFCLIFFWLFNVLRWVFFPKSKNWARGGFWRFVLFRPLWFERSWRERETIFIN